MRPKIALTADTLEKATNIINQRNAAYAPQPIIQAIIKSGGIPLILPTINPKFVSNYINLFDGVCFTGGVDIDPTFYGKEPLTKLGPTYRKRDSFEIELLKQSIRAKKAILGICRGMQLINVGLGGSLYQDISENPTSTLKHMQKAPGNIPSHHINIDKNSRLFKLVGSRTYVNSRHHQALKNVSPFLKIVAKADDQTIESVESINSNQILGVQWHPENMYKHYKDSKNIFKDFINRSQKTDIAYKESKNIISSNFTRHPHSEQ